MISIDCLLLSIRFQCVFENHILVPERVSVEEIITRQTFYMNCAIHEVQLNVLSDIAFLPF